MQRRTSVSAVLVAALVATAAIALPGLAGAAPVTRQTAAVPVCAQASAPNHMTCSGIVRTPATAAPATNACSGSDPIGVGPANGYTPADLATAYSYNSAAKTPKQVVAVVDWHDDPSIAKDLAAFDACYGFKKETATSFRKVNQTGLAAPLPKRDETAALEISMDVETVRAVCQTCAILLVEANSSADTDVAAAENEAVALGATEVSNSFGEPEKQVSPAVQAAYNHPGVVITASTGQHGWFGWDTGNTSTSQDAPSFPSTSPYVVSVGGTLLQLNNNGTRSEETVWNENGVEDQAGLQQGAALGAGGSGCSTRYAAMPWQLAEPGYGAAACNGKRLAADVSADADPNTGLDVYDSLGQPGWIMAGGMSAPMIAAMFALAGGAGTAAYPASSVYVNSNQRPASAFDVVPTDDGLPSGNSFCGGAETIDCGTYVNTAVNPATHNPNALGAGVIDCSFPRDNSDPAVAPARSSECNATTGYDGPTGVGTPNGIALLTNTAPRLTLGIPASPKAGVALRIGATAHETIAGAFAVNYTFDWGDGHKSTTTTSPARHTYATAGTYTITLTVTDSLNQIAFGTFSITVG